MIDWTVTAECAIYNCEACNGTHCSCSCHCFPCNDDGEPVSLYPYEDDLNPVRGIVNGCICGLLMWVGIILAGWAIWKAVHYA
jgi:hypothetical protein